MTAPCDRGQERLRLGSAQSTIASDTPNSVQLTDYIPQDATTFASQRYIICVLVADSQTLTMTYVTSASPAG